MMTTQMKGDKGMKYTKLVASFKVETVISLQESVEFRENFSRYVKAVDKEAFLLAVETQCNSIKMEENTMSLNTQTEEEIYGMKSLPVSEEQERIRRAAAFFDRLIAYAKVFNTIKNFPEFLDRGAHKILFTLGKWVINNLVKGSAEVENCNHWVKAKGESAVAAYVAAWQTLRSVPAFNANNGIKDDTKSYTFVSMKYNGFVVSVKPGVSPMARMVTGDYAKKPVSFEITAKTDFDALARVLYVDSVGRLHKPVHAGNAVSVYGEELNSNVVPMTVVDALVLVSASRAELGSVEESSDNFLVISQLKNGPFVGNPLLDRAFRSKYADKGFFGVSNPDVLNDGVVSAVKTAPGYFEVENGKIRSIEKGMGKVIARFVKLGDKTGLEQMTLRKVFIVTDTMGNAQVDAMLSSGSIHVPTSVLRKHGQCRVVNNADKGGFKATLSPVAFVSNLLDEQGISIASFGSVKAKMYGIASLLGNLGLVKANLKERVISLDKVGTKVKGVFVENVELQVTNHYLIQAYRPTNRDRLLTDEVMATEAQEKRALTRANTVEQDLVFASFVMAARDEIFNGDLVETLRFLEESGDVKKKSTKTTITPSEFNLLATMTDVATAKEFIDELVNSKLNEGKQEEYNRLFDFLTKSYDEERVAEMSINDFFRRYVSVCTAHNVDLKSPVGNFVRRNFLVALCKTLFAGVQDRKDYLRIKDANGNSVTLPVNDFMFGDFYKTSTIYEESVVVTGFLFKLLKYVQYGADMYANKGTVSKFTAEMFFSNVKNELQCELTGKNLGKMKAKGLYGVLAPAWWSTDVAKVWFPGKNRFSKEKYAMLVKHPILFPEAISSVAVLGGFPAKLTKGISEADMEVINFALSTTIFCHEDVLLTLQNDCDGDLTRLTFHSKTYAPMFSNAALSDGYFANSYHKAYANKERGFTDFGDYKFTDTFTPAEVMDGLISAAVCKMQVGLFTAHAQKFGAVQTKLGYGYESEKGRLFRFLLNTFVQEFAMNDIKQKDGKAVIKLPEYFLTNNIGLERFLDWKAPLVEFIEKTLGADMSQYGFDSNEDFYQEFYKAMTDLSTHIDNKGLPGGVRLVSKEYTLHGAGKNNMCGSVANKKCLPKYFKGENLEDYLVSKYL